MNKPEKSYRTKKKLAEALKVLLRKKPLDQIRIHEITDLCELNRQTFYYHFPDIYALFSWSVQQAIEQFDAHQKEMLARDSNMTWQNLMLALLKELEQDRTFFITALDSCFDAELKNYFTRRFQEKDDVSFPPLQTAAVISILFHWLRQKNRQKPEEMVEFFQQMLQDEMLCHESIDLHI